MPKLRECRVRGCEKQNDCARFFSFPRDQEARQMWKENLGIATEELPIQHAFVCLHHFEADSVGGKCLKNGAIPTLNLGYDGPPPHGWIAPKPKRSCCVQTCVSTERRILFAFPRSGDARNAWALACKVPQPSITDRLFVCQRHFEPKNVTKYKVLNGAFPCLNLEPATRSRSPSTCSEWVCPPTSKVYSRKIKEEEEDDLTLEEFEKYSILEERRQANEGSDVCDDLHTTTERERFAQAARYYQSNALKLNKKIKELEIENERLKQKYVNLISRSIIAEESASVDAITFAKMIVKTTKSPYTDEEKALAQNINYMSSKAYSFMRDDLGFALPHKSSLLRWRPIRYVVPGFDANVIENLNKIVKTMSDTERICVLLFDEISIKPDLTYNQARDCIDGYVDHGDGEREMQIGNKCLFFMVKGLCSKWKYVFSYYISKSGINAEGLLRILNKTLKSLKDIGLNVKALVCDQGASNRGLFGRLNLYQTTPYFMHENEKIFCMYDYCHLIKTIRNTLMHYDILTPDGIATFRVVKDLFRIDQANPNFKICPKLTDAHIYPRSLEKMSVSRATQVLSNSVASGIEMLSNQKLFDNSNEYVVKNAKSTQTFVKKMNDFFDELDCKHFQSNNPFKCPLKRGDTEKIRRLKTHLQYFRSLKLPTGAHVECIGGAALTISSMLQLSEELFERFEDIKFVSLGKLNQDALENFFFRIRASQGINTHPTAHDVQYIVARLISMKILRQKFENTGSNCEDDDDITLDWNLGPTDRHLEEELNDPQYEQLVIEDINIPDENFVEDCEKAEVQVQRYFTGYGVYQKILCKIKCEKCTTIMMKTQGDLQHYSEALIKSKNYTEDTDLRLVNPENRVFEVCRLQMMWYRQLFEKYAHRVGLRNLLVSSIREKTANVFPEWFAISGDCRDHRVKLLDFLIKVLLFKNAKWLLQNVKDITRDQKCEAKLKKLAQIAGRGPKK